jgi:DNA polymerase elongation subunit (family B)
LTLNIKLIDIETSPIVAYTWETYDTNVLKVLEPSKIISCSWKTLGVEDLTTKCIADYKSYKANVVNDEALVKEVWNVLDEADIVIAHHGDAFDLKKLNARFVYYGLNAPTPYQSIDTYKAASKYFKFDSKSLNSLGAYLNVGQKISNGGFDLWVRCIAGDKEAWKAMKDYNAQDVILLENVYYKLRPFISNHPDLNSFADNQDMACGSCRSTNLIKRGFSPTKTGSRQRYQCTDCGSWTVGSWKKYPKAEAT